MAHLDNARILETAERLPSMGEIVTNILASIDRPGINIRSVAHEIGRDPVVTGRVLRVANAAFFGHSGKVGSIADAIILLGLDTVRTIAISASFVNWVNRCERSTLGLDRLGFWQHAIGTAACAKVIGGSLGQDRELCFVGGLLHNIGQFLLIALCGADYAEVRNLARRDAISLNAAEQRLLEVDSSTAGYLLLKHWNFPPTIQEAVRHHAFPESPTDPLTAIVHVGHVLAQALDLGHSGSDRVDRLSADALNYLELDLEQLATSFGIMESSYYGLTDSLGPQG